MFRKRNDPSQQKKNCTSNEKTGIVPERMYKYGKRTQKEIYPNVVNQEFNIGKKNQIWFGDISYIPTKEGMLYLSVDIAVNVSGMLYGNTCGKV